jgi:hypothetical protein
LSDLQVIPSTLQVNEGKSLTTSLSGFTPNSTLYFKVSGRGISKKDLASGGVKGRVQVDANGVATISHTLRADKKTEGEESFAIQVFSDKKMRNLRGESDSVSVLDTSVKAGKPPGEGSENETKNEMRIKDLLTGQIIKSDTVNSGFFTSASGKKGSYEDAQYEIEMSPTTLIFTLRADNWIGPNAPQPERFDVGRSVLTGSFRTDNNGNLSGTVDRRTYFGLQSNSQTGLFMETAQSYKVAKGTNISNSLAGSPSSLISATYFYSNLSDVGFDTDGRFPSTPRYNNRNDITGLADTSFFQEGWWQDPFAPNLI